MILKKVTAIKLVKWVNCILICTLALLISACSSLEKMKTYYENRKVAVFVTPSGSTTKVVSNSENVIQNAPKIRNIKYNQNMSICKPNNLMNETIELEREEVTFELSFMINSLNHQKPYYENGRKFRRLSSNMVTNLYNTPDCKTFRYKLHIISKLLDGHNLKSMDN